jgi:hypothetical protein
MSNTNSAPVLFSQHGRNRGRDSGLAGLSDQEVARKARDKSLSPQERIKYKSEEKYRQMRRNRQQKNNGIIPPVKPEDKKDEKDKDDENEKPKEE